MISTPKPVICFGGSFNPIHYGHLRTVGHVREIARFDKILLIPSGNPPHKLEHLELAPPLHRFKMTQLGAGELEKCDVSDLEIKASGPSYTLKTARRLKSLGINPVYWLIGSDLLPGLPNWHEPHALLSEVRFVVVQRPGAIIRWEQLPQMVQPLRQFVVDVPPIDVSSSQIRALVRAGRPITGLVPDAVEHYIHQHRLYQDPVSDSHP